MYPYAQLLVDYATIYVNTSITLTDMNDLDLEELKVIKTLVDESMKKNTNG